MRQLALEPHAVGVRPAEELVGGQSVVDAEPVRELTFGAARGRQRRDAETEGQEPVEGVAQVACADDLRRVTLRGVRRPDVQVVAELRREKPSRERREELRQLDVLLPQHVVRVAEVIDVRRIQAQLVEIPRVAEEPEVDLAFLAVEQQEPEVGDVLRCLFFSSDSSVLGLRETRRCTRPTPRCRCRRSPTTSRADTAPSPKTSRAPHRSRCRRRNAHGCLVSIDTRWWSVARERAPRALRQKKDRPPSPRPVRQLASR